MTSLGYFQLQLVRGWWKVIFLDYSCNFSVNLKLFQHKTLNIKVLVPKMNEINILTLFLSGYHMHIVNIFYLYTLSKHIQLSLDIIPT